MHMHACTHTPLYTSTDTSKSFLEQWKNGWTGWVKDHKHGLSHSEAESLLTLLRACAWAPPGDGDVASIYKLAVNDLKESEVWKNHIGMRQWLSTMWLNIPEVCLIVHVF